MFRAEESNPKLSILPNAVSDIMSLLRRWHHGCCAVLWPMLALFLRELYGNIRLLPVMMVNVKIWISPKTVSVSGCTEKQKYPLVMVSWSNVQYNCIGMTCSLIARNLISCCWRLPFDMSPWIISKPFAMLPPSTFCNGIRIDPKLDGFPQPSRGR